MKLSLFSAFSGLRSDGKGRLAIVGLASLLALAGCDGLSTGTDNKYESKQKQDLYKNGSILSDEGGTDLLGGGNSNKKDSDALGIGVNGFLWRAALDTIAFMPITSADPFGGVITTDWYSAPDAPNDRAKLNILILDRELRADGVKVSVFRQTRGVSNEWTDTSVSPATGSQIEETILTRARQMRLAQRDLK